MSQLYEYQNTKYDDANTMYGIYWVGQTFTVGGTAHTVTSVKIKACRYGNPGTLTLSIRATSGSLPTGGDLTSGTIDANTFTTDTAGAWYEITVTLYLLSASIMYAIVCRCSSGNGTNYSQWRLGTGAGTYPNGASVSSSNSGSSWAVGSPAGDRTFEVWGNPPVTIPTVTTQAADGIGLD